MTAGTDTGFGDLLRRARRAAGHSQEELAERAGISARSISDLERGVTRRDTLELIADALDLPKDERAAWERARRTIAGRSEPSSARPRGVAHVSSVPTPLTSVVGREREIAEIAGQLRQGVRLLTVTGPGGVGKTRLSIAVAHEIAATFEDGAWFIDLSALRDSELVLPTIATTIGIVTTGNRPALDDLTAALQRQHRLLVLDNLEQVIAAAPSLEALLTACPSLAILTTSRVPLRVPGEQEFPLAALGLPARPGPPGPDDALRSDAVRLFMQRANAIRPDLQLSTVSAPVIAEICARLDGLPLAIELVAARTRTLSPQAILQRLDHRLDLLATHGESIPARQRTMRGAIQWSYELLSLEQQQLFRRLSVFAGGATLEASEAVAGDEVQRDLLDRVEQLVEHSLIQMREQPDGASRYVMLETIREFGMEQLAVSAELDQTRNRHADYFGELVSAPGADAEDRYRRAWLELLSTEHDNLRAALGYLREQRDATRGLPLVAVMGRFWIFHGPFAEGCSQTVAFLSMLDPSDRSEDRAEALRSLANLAAYQGDADAAVDASQEALEILQERGSVERIPGALLVCGIAAAMRGEIERATALWQETVIKGRETGDVARVALAFNTLAVQAREAGNLDEAALMLREALSLMRYARYEANVPLVLSNLATVSLDAGRVAEAETFFHEALQLSREMHERPPLVTELFGLARVARVREQHVRAARLLGASDALREMIGGRLPSPPSEDVESEHTLLRAALGAEAFDAAWEGGRFISVEQAIDEALRDEAEA